MEKCELCEKQAKKKQSGNPHIHLKPFEEPRIFPGKKPYGYEEQDYQCLLCQAKFTHSTNRNDLSWTLWQG